MQTCRVWNTGLAQPGRFPPNFNAWQRRVSAYTPVCIETRGYTAGDETDVGAGIQVGLDWCGLRHSVVSRTTCSVDTGHQTCPPWTAAMVASVLRRWPDASGNMLGRTAKVARQLPSGGGRCPTRLVEATAESTGAPVAYNPCPYSTHLLGEPVWGGGGAEPHDSQHTNTPPAVAPCPESNPSSRRTLTRAATGQNRPARRGSSPTPPWPPPQNPASPKTHDGALK